MQFTKAMRDKSAAASKSHNLMDKLSATEAAKEGCSPSARAAEA